jgi:hypothetical protein
MSGHDVMFEARAGLAWALPPVAALDEFGFGPREGGLP